MPRRSHKVLLSKLGGLAFKLNAELDKGSLVSVDDALNAASETRVIAFMREKLGDDHWLSFLDAEDEITISEYFDRVAGGLCPEEVGVHHNGICWLLALTIEMIQQQDWTTFDDPTASTS
jgi:hypothetical protein